MAAPALSLLLPDVATLDAAIEGPHALSRVLGGRAVAEDWAGFPEALPRTRDELAADPRGARWRTRLFVLEQPPTLVGWGGFKGPPDEGTVELGYAIAPDFRRRGLATEAVAQMLAEAFADDEVRTVIAHTLPEQNASTRVLERAGFANEGEVTEGEATVWRWRRERGAGPRPS
jgi:ribosomal-protein-alanine N-acetyltransferase